MQLVLAKIRKVFVVFVCVSLQAARELLTLPEDDPRRIFQGAAIIRRMARLGLVSEEEMKLDMILELSTAKLMDRRLQTKVFKLGLAKSIHHARVLIKQRHIRVGHQLVNSPSFMVHVDSEKHIQFSENSPYGGGRPVCVCVLCDV